MTSNEQSTTATAMSKGINNTQNEIKNTLYITHVDSYGPYLRISGYNNSEDINILNKKIQQILVDCYAINPTWQLARQQSVLRTGILCIHKTIKENSTTEFDFQRARIKNVSVNNNQQLEIEADFIDYGYTLKLSSFEILLPEHPELLESIPSKCSHYIMLGICFDWKKAELDEILSMIKHQHLDINVVMEYQDVQFITMKWKNFNFVEFLIHHRRIGAPIANQLLLDNFSKIYKQKPFFTSHTSVANGNNNNYYTNNNNNNTNNNNNNNIKTNNVVNGAAPHKDIKNKLEVQKLLPSRILSERLKQYQQPQVQPNLNYIPNPVQPRLPYNIANLRSIMQGIQYQNNQIPYGTQNYMHLQSMGIYSNRNLQAPIYQRYPTPERMEVTSLNQNKEYMYPLLAQRNMPVNPINMTQNNETNTYNRSTRSNNNAFTSKNLVIGTIYEACISFVENGPSLFCVQLSSQESKLTNMMNEIERLQLKRLPFDPVVGTACIARYSEDGQLYRALVTGVTNMGYKVAYIDYGNSELVSRNELYEIPAVFLKHEPYAMRFCLTGVKELEPIDESFRKTFKDLVLYKKFKLKVMPLEGPPLCQYCDLYTEGKNLFEVLKQIQMSRLVYPKAVHLENSDTVEIRYIESPQNFYVQKIVNIDKFEKLMDDMYLYYNKNQKVPESLVLGAPCIVKYDKEWYRAEIMRVDDKTIVVRHVDFGYEQTVKINLLSTIAEEHLKLPRQAVQCCLKGFEKNDLIKDNVTIQFEMLAEESNRKRRSFAVKVFRIEPDGVNLINLFTKEFNVMKKLYKLNMPFEQFMTFEKEEIFMKNHRHISASADNGYKMGSTASSSDLHSTYSDQKDNHFNSTLLGDERHRSYQQQQLQRRDTKQQPRQSNQLKFPTQQRNQYNKMNKSVTSNEGDINSSASSSNEKQNKQHLAVDRRSTGSLSSSSNKYQTDANKQQRRNNSYIQNDNQRQKSGITARRPQNAPQGYSQQQKIIKQITPPPAPTPTPASAEPKKVEEPKHVEEFMPMEFSYTVQTLDLPKQNDVVLIWWASPHQFYVQLKSRLTEFDVMVQEMQEYYKKMSAPNMRWKNGSCAIIRVRKDNTIYRARIVGCNHMLRRYKAFCVDIGNFVYVTPEDIYKVEKRFAKMPVMAFECGFQGILLNYDRYHILDHIKHFLPKDAKTVCQFIKFQNSKYFVNIKINDAPLRDSLKAEGLIVDRPDLNVDLLKGQQIRVKITSIQSMINFKVHLEHCDKNVQFICSYHDVRFVKSNGNIEEKFKQFYEGKSCVVNVVDIDEHKVCYLKPLLPLFKTDIPTYICTYPITMTKFNALVVHIETAYRLYVQPEKTEREFKKLFNDMRETYDKNGTPLTKFEIDQICAAKSSDGNWYRARIVECNQKSVKLFYIDYGNMELREKSCLKKLEEKFYVNKSAYVVEVNLPVIPLEAEKTQNMKANASKSAELKKLNTMIFNKLIHLQPIEVHKNRLIAEISLDGKSLTDVMKSQQLIKDINLEKMRSLIDTEKSNVFEYIETVDLTQEEESDSDKKLTKKNKISSPKKQKAEEKPIATEKPITATKIENVIMENIFKPLTDEIIEKPVLLETPTVEVDVEVEAEVTQTLPIESVEQKKEDKEEIEKSERMKNMEQGVLAHCDNPTQFFLHPKDSLEQLNKLQENLQIISTSLPPLMRVMNDAHCISLYSVDKQWYRAKIIDAELMVLKFIDYGNTDCVSDTTDVKEMSVFPDIEPLCIPCALPIKPNGTADWVDAANTIFNESYCKLLHYKYLTHGDAVRRSFIELYVGNVNVAEKLIQDGYAKPLELARSGYLCYISHVNNISDFYIQYEVDTKALELIEIYLKEQTDWQIVEKFEYGKIVAALFPEDEMWYRAKLLKDIPNKGYEVLFIDYGNTSISPQCRIISDKIAKIPSFSKKCALDLPENCLSWSITAEEKFNDIAAAGETIFTVELREPAVDHAKVYLYIDDRNINDDLEPLCDTKPLTETEANVSFGNSTIASVYDNDTIYDATISHINSLSDFYVQFSKDSIRIEDIVFSLNSLGMDAVQQPEVGLLCAARYKTDNKLHRARILDIISIEQHTYRVHFIDYGNIAESNDVRVLPQDLVQLKQFCMNCTLDNAEKFERFGNAATEALNVLLNVCGGAIKVVLLDKETKPAVVKVYAANTEENLNETLEKLLINLEVPNSLNNVLSSDAEQSATAIEDATIVESKTKIAKATCRISHAESPENFYIQLAKSANDLELVTNSLKKSIVDGFHILKVVEYGNVGCAYIEDDELYYRGRIDGILASRKYELFLIDYGYSVQVDSLRKLPKEICNIAPLAVPCKLNAIPDAPPKKVKEAFTLLMEQHFGDFFEIDVDEVDADGVHTVKLQCNYKDLAEELAEMLKPDKDEVLITSPLPKLHACNLIIVNSINSFYIQLKNDIPAIERITDILLDAEKDFQPLNDVRVGTICAALFPEDSAYYRAKIVQILEDGQCEVHYVDFGNNAVTDKLYSLPENLINEPAYSKHCALDMNCNTLEANKQFHALVGQHVSGTFQVEFLKTTVDPCICRLFLEDKNVALELTQQLKASKDT